MMMKTYAILFLLIASSAFAQTDSNLPETNTRTPVNADKVLIVYLSRTYNTQVIADMIQEKVGGTLVALELETPYPENYQATVQQVQQENESGFLPPLKTSIDNIAAYDIIFLSFPTWGMQLPPPAKSFLHQYDLSGKTVIPFNTNAGYGTGTSFETKEALCTDARIPEGFAIRGGKERDGVYLALTGEKVTEAETKVEQWLQKIGMIK